MASQDHHNDCARTLGEMARNAIAEGDFASARKSLSVAALHLKGGEGVDNDLRAEAMYVVADGYAQLLMAI